MKDQQNTDTQDARRYRFLRETSFRSKTPKGAWIEVHYAAKQNPNWPMMHAFEDLDRAIDEAMKGGVK